MTYEIRVVGDAFRVFENDRLTKGRFHTREQAQAWIDQQQKRGLQRQGKAQRYGTPNLRPNYYLDNELRIREMSGDA